MAIFRGTGGSGDASSNVSINQVTEKALEAEAAANAAASSATSAANSASSASTSATNAATSESNASTSATNASNSATTASNAATAAGNAQTAAETAETNAETAETNAETAEANAVTAQGLAEDAQTYAEEWAVKAEDVLVSTDAGGDGSTDYSALHHAAKASASATAASDAQTGAETAQGLAEDARDDAVIAQGLAEDARDDAVTAKTAAEAARDSALTALDSFDDRYLGVKSADPTLDNDGNALVSGALYFNSVDNAMKVYDGTQWLEAYASGEDFLAKANNLSDLPNAATARTNLGLGTAATTDATDYATAAQGSLADTATQPGDLGTAAALDVGTGANNVVQLDGSGALPAVDGSNLTNVSSVANLDDLTDVDTTGVQDGETIVYNSGTSSWEPGVAVSGLSNVVEDTTPQLGGDLDLNGSDITGTGDINITGSVTATSADINGGTIDGVTIGGASAGAITATTITGSGDMNIDSGTLFVDASEGRVGIGTTSPATALHVSDSGTEVVSIDRTDSYGQALEFIRTGVTTSCGIGTAGANSLGFYVQDSEAARVQGDGQFLIGTTSSTINTTNFGTALGVVIKHSRNATGAVAQFYGTAGECRILGDGDIQNTNNSYTGISDIKFKQNITDANSQWDDIKSIQVRNYELIDYPDRRHIGVVAQELEQVCPNLVVDRDAEYWEEGEELPEGVSVGDVKEEGYKSVAYSILYMKAVKALQEAMERIETLEAEVAILKGN